MRMGRLCIKSVQEQTICVDVTLHFLIKQTNEFHRSALLHIPKMIDPAVLKHCVTHPEMINCVCQNERIQTHYENRCIEI
jgi:hypothetical protein